MTAVKPEGGIAASIRAGMALTPQDRQRMAGALAVIVDADQRVAPTRRRGRVKARRPPGVHYGRDRVVRPDQADPSAWSPNRDGSWTSPAGRRVTSRTWLDPLIARRAVLGMSTTYAEAARRGEVAQ